MIAKRSFGGSGVEASVVGFGAWTLGLDWWGEVTEEQARGMVGRAIDLGVTFFDTADTYGAGVGEERLGAALKGRRDEVTIGTKFGYDITVPHDQSSHSERPTNWSPDHIRSACEASLKRLGTDVIDLYELHNPRMAQIRDDAIFEVLSELRSEGKIRSFGVALGPAIGWEASGVEAIRTRDIDALQTVFNLLEQSPGDTFLAEAGSADKAAHPTGSADKAAHPTGSADKAAHPTGDVGIIARVPHASDALSGRFEPGRLPTDVFGSNDHRAFRKRAWLERALDKVARLDFLFEGRTVAQAALAWVIADPGITTVLPTITDIEQLEEFAGAADKPLTEEEYRRVQELYARDFDLPPERPEEKTEIRVG